MRLTCSGLATWWPWSGGMIFGWTKDLPNTWSLFQWRPRTPTSEWYVFCCIFEWIEVGSKLCTKHTMHTPTGRVSAGCLLCGNQSWFAEFLSANIQSSREPHADWADVWRCLLWQSRCEVLIGIFHLNTHIPMAVYVLHFPVIPDKIKCSLKLISTYVTCRQSLVSVG